MSALVPASERDPVAVYLATELIRIFSGVETEAPPFCAGCGGQRFDWVEAGWRCQECGRMDLMREIY